MSDNQENNKIEYNELKKKKTVYRDLPPCLNSPIGFGYIHSKAWKFLKRGAEIYQKNDPCGMPGPDFNIDEIKKGCEQIIQCRGYEIENPLQLSISGMNDLMATFHFRMVSQKGQDKENIISWIILFINTLRLARRFYYITL